MEKLIDTAAHIRNLEVMLRCTPRGNARDEEMRDQIEIQLGELRSGRYHATLRDISADDEWMEEARRRARIV